MEGNLCGEPGGMPARRGWPSNTTPGRGKGSHGELYLGGRRTIVKAGELSKGLLAALLKQLDINREEF